MADCVYGARGGSGLGLLGRVRSRRARFLPAILRGVLMYNVMTSHPTSCPTQAAATRRKLPQAAGSKVRTAGTLSSATELTKQRK